MAGESVRVLLIGAHPADCLEKAGGTLAHHAQRGDRVTVLIVTLGAWSHHWRLMDENDEHNVEERQAQVARAMQAKLEEARHGLGILGIDDVRTLGLDDSKEVLTQETVDRIAEVILEVKPDVVITEHPYDLGGFNQHATVGGATIYACKRARSLPQPGSDIRHHVASIYFMSPIGRLGHAMGRGSSFIAQVDVYIDITDVIEKKVRALDCLGSQYMHGDYARKMVETHSGAAGFAACVPYAESFQRYSPWVSCTLPISDFELRRARQTHEELVGRRGTILAVRVPPHEDAHSRSGDTGQDAERSVRADGPATP